MDAITVSPKFQVVTPLKVRERLKIQRGQKLQVIAYDNRVVLIPIMQLPGLDTAELRIADLYKGKVIELDAPLALSAAKISTEMKLPMADSILLATPRSHNATLWTQDEHFSGIEGVRFIRRK